MHIGPLQRYEKETFVEMALASWRAAYVGLLSEEEVVQAPQMLAEAEDKRCEAFQVLRDQSGGFIGFYSLGEGDYLWHLYVHPDQFRKGCGTILLEAAEAEIRTRGHDKVSLDVLAGNQRALSFYLAQGFVVSGQDADGHVLMEKSLG
ncbi:MAG: GNAT family N-acetyltransferase [Alphaproteobacteria bacterium]|nr:MAG: GNAT family N-acetyltransferase [Alphaproteobacteria bacterium]